MSDPSMTPRQPSLAKLGAASLGVAAIALSATLVAQSVPQAMVTRLPGALSTQQPVGVSASAPDHQIVCAGPFLGFVQQETTPRGFGEPTVTILGAEAEVIELRSEELLDVFAGTEAKMATLPVFATQSAEAGFLAGVSSQNLDTPFGRGYQASVCQSTQSESWLVGGSTTTGRQTVVTLSNPGSVQAVVNLEIYGQSGPVSAPAARGILLQPGERRVFSLSGLAPDESSPVIRVQSSGTPITATLHVSLTRGLQPDGLDVVSAQQAPSLMRVLPGLWLEAEEQLGLVRGLEGYGDIGPVLRLLAPEANADVEVIVERAIGEPTRTTVTLTGGKTFDVALDELGQGYAAIRIVADQPVVAGIRQSSVGEGKTDLAWVPSADEISTVGSVVVPGGIDATLQLSNISDQPITVNYARVSNDGASVLGQGRIELQAGEFAARSLGNQGGNYLFETTGLVALGVSLRDNGEIAHLRVGAPPAAQPEVSIFAR